MDKDLRLQVILGAVNKMTAPMKAAQNSNRKLAKAVQATRKEVRALNDQSGRIAGFRKNRQALAELDREMHEARARVKALSAAIRQGSGDTATLTRQQKAAINTARKLKASHADLSATLRREREALQQNGIDTRKLAAAQASLKEKTQQATHALEAQQKRLRISGEAQARYQKVMSQRNSMLIGGGFTMAQGTAGLLAMKPMLDAAATYSQHIERFRYQGATDSQIQDAKAFTTRNQITGNSQTDMMRLYTEAYTMTRDEHHAKEATVDLAKAATALKLVAAKGLLNPEQAAAFEHYTYALIKTAEMRNEIASPEKLHAFVNDSVQAYVSSQGMVSPADVYEFMKPGGLAAKDIDTKELLFGFSHIMQEMGAERAGNALNSARQNWVYARTKEAYGDRMLELGLTDKVTYSKSGHVKNFDLKNVRKFTSNPIEYLLEDVVPQIEKIKPKWAMDSNGNLDMALAISKLFSNRTASDLFTTIYTQRENIKRQMAAASHAQSMDTVISEGQNGPAGQQLILEARKSDLYRQLGDNIQPLYVAGLSKLNDLLKGLNGFIEKHPKLAHYFIVAAAGISAMAVAGGALTVAMAGLLGPLAVARYGFSALTGKEMPAAGKAIKWLVRSPIALLRGAFMGVASAAAALGLPVTLVIGALVAGAFMVWKYWDRVKAWFGGFLDELKPVWEAVKDLFAPLVPMFTWIGDKIKAAIKWIEDFLTPVKSTKEELNNAAESGRTFGKVVAEGLLEVIDTAKNLFGWIGKVSDGLAGIAGWAWNGIKETFSNSNASPISPSGIPFGGTFDTGGTLSAGRWGIVGERGPEIITGPASIASRSRTAELANLAMSLPGMMTGIIQGMLPIQSPETLPLHPHAVFAGSQSPAGRPQHTESHSVLLQPEIHIHAAPTQSPQEIAEMVMRALRKERRREESRRRSTYRDRS
ncbi:hypothetical protein J9K13_002435 [Salmonella enterica]|nr:hypothetical protein [Salmonella enterica]HEC8457740.1 hypothetical protein [Salmonella enterica subsp. enterica serovar Poona]